MEPLQYEERGYLKEPFRLFHLADGRGEYIEYHYHTFHKIIILLAGKAGYAVEGERYDLSPGDFVLVGSGSIHRPIVEAGDYYERMILYIAPEYLRSLAQGDCDPEECFRRAQETFQYVFRDEGTSRVRVLFQSLAETVRQGGYGASLLAQAQFTELLVEVNRVVRGGHRVGAAGGDSKVISLLQYLNLHLTESLTIDEGAVAPWNSLMWSLMTDVCRAMGVRTDVPFNQLSPKERDIVFHGPAEKKHIFYHSKNTNQAGELDFTYYNAVYTVQNALAKVKDEKGMKRVERFLKTEECPDCGGSRLSAAARAPLVRGISLADACRMTLSELVEWVRGVPDTMPEEMRPMARNICESLLDASRRLLDLGVGYLSLDRAASTLSTGERQRMQLARAVRNRTTGVLYVLDEPSIGLHPANIAGLAGVMEDLVADGNSVVLVDHDTQVLRGADHIIEMGPGAGSSGGRVIAEGTLREVECNPASKIGPFLSGEAEIRVRSRCSAAGLFEKGRIHLSTDAIHTVKPLEADIPKGRLTVVTGVSGSGKTTLVLESLIPALKSKISRTVLPGHVRSVEAEGIRQVKLIDASPIGINVRSTVATYANVHDELRKVYARTPDARRLGFKDGDFSYNTGRLRCPTCDGTGIISLDVQFLPDVDIPCPDCRGSRYSRQAFLVRRENEAGEFHSLPELMAMDVNEALAACGDLKTVSQRLNVLQNLGLGYLTLGEQTPGLSGGEAQRLKLASEMGRGQDDSLFVFDEPTIGLHPSDVQTLLQVFQTLVDHGATVIVIEHDLDVIRNADYIVDMGPGGGEEGGRIVVEGTPEQVRACRESVTGKYI